MQSNQILSYILIERNRRIKKRMAQAMRFSVSYNHRLKSMPSPSKNGRTNPLDEKTISI